MSRIISLTIAHYGTDYIGYVLRAVAKVVDEVFVLYTQYPSHGTDSIIPCPDSRQAMLDTISAAGVGPKLTLIEGNWRGEGVHRGAISDYVNPGDLIVVADADEIWDITNLYAGLERMESYPSIMWYKVRMTNLWRSFNWQCTDPMTQDRIIRVGGDPNTLLYSEASQLPDNPDIWHFGYARKPIDIAYKMAIHGHAAEIYPEWYQDKFLNWKPGVEDCHPACRNFWYPKPFDKTLLPEDLKSHPYYSMDLIE